MNTDNQNSDLKFVMKDATEEETVVEEMVHSHVYITYNEIIEQLQNAGSIPHLSVLQDGDDLRKIDCSLWNTAVVVAMQRLRDEDRDLYDEYVAVQQEKYGMASFDDEVTQFAVLSVVMHKINPVETLH